MLISRNVFARAFCAFLVIGCSVTVFAATDVLVLIDSTGSMEGLEDFKTALDGILAAVNADSPCSETVMYGVADYRNYYDGGNYQAYGVNLVEPFTYSVTDAMSAIDTLSAGGGGDEPESQLKAMVTITDNWLTTSGDLGFNGRAEAQKIIIWSGDQPGHDAQDPPAGYYPTLDETIGALTAQGIMVFALNSSGDYSGLDEIYHGRYQASEITAATGGMLFNNVGSGGPEIEEPIVGAITCIPFDKDDGIEEWDCRSPGEEITYTISWYNESEATLEDTIIVDDLPAEVYYPGGFVQYDPNDPFNPIPPDPAYDPNTHTYTWQLGDVMPDETGFAEITVVVTEAAQPGMRIENVAKMISAGMMFGWNSHETLVCCWDTVDPNIIYVDKNATGYITGVDWQNAYTDLQSALKRARESVCDVGPYTILVAQGLYTPGDYEEDTFMLPAGVSLYGGFKTGGCPFEQRNPDRYVPTLTGYIGLDENNHIRRNETVVMMGHNTLLDGFTVTESSRYGAYGENADFTIENCKVIENSQWGIYAENGNVIVRWCEVVNNGWYGIHHVGAGYTLTLENSRIIENKEHGIRSDGSTPIIKNSVIAGNGYSDGGFFGISMYLPTEVPVLHNNTIAYNANAGISWVDDVGSGVDPNVLDYPDIQNCILWYNNDGGEQLAGYDFTQYSCVYDLNDSAGTDYDLDGFGNFSGNPGFAYEYSDDPNVMLNVHLAYDSPCIDRGNPNHDANDVGSYDMDAEDRIVDSRVDIGADEVYSCGVDLSADDIYHPLDWSADGIVNMHEYAGFARAWLSADPNNPLCDPNNIDYVSDPNDPGFISEGDKLRYRLRWDIDDDMDVDMADFALFCDEWLWTACWRDSQTYRFEMMAMAMGGGESMMSAPMSATLSMDSTVSAAAEPKFAFPSESDLARFINGVNEINDYLDRAIKEDHPNSEALYDMKAALKEILIELRDDVAVK